MANFCLNPDRQENKGDSQVVKFFMKGEYEIVMKKIVHELREEARI